MFSLERKLEGQEKLVKVNALAVHEIFVVVDDSLSLRMRGQLRTHLAFLESCTSVRTAARELFLYLKLERSRCHVGVLLECEARTAKCTEELYSLLHPKREGCPHSNARHSHYYYPVHACKHLQGI